MIFFRIAIYLLTALFVLTVVNAHAQGVEGEVIRARVVSYTPLVISPDSRFTPTVRVENLGTVTIPFEIIILHGGPAWGGKDQPYSITPNSEVYRRDAIPTGVVHFWRGLLSPNEMAVFALPTVSSNLHGRFLFMETVIVKAGLIGSGETISHYLEVLSVDKS